MLRDIRVSPVADTVELVRPRVLRLDGAIHHVVVRHPAGEPLFAAASDRARLDEVVGDLLRAQRARAHAYCWMSNHVHLAVEIDPGRAGAFQCALAAELRVPAPAEPPLLVDAHAWLLRLVRYIHLNPVRAGIVDSAANYPWSGHGVYLGRPGVPWLATDLALRLLGGDLLRATAAYRAFVVPVLIGIDRESLVEVPWYPARW